MISFVLSGKVSDLFFEAVSPLSEATNLHSHHSTCISLITMCTKIRHLHLPVRGRDCSTRILLEQLALVAGAALAAFFEELSLLHHYQLQTTTLIPTL